MNPSFSILEKIKSLFYLTVNSANDYRVEFAPFAFTLTNEDFIFLKGNEESGSDASKSYREMSEFSVIANSIPEDPYLWTINSRFLYDVYENIILEAALIDPDYMTDDEKVSYESAKAVLYNTVDNTKTDKYSSYGVFLTKCNDIDNRIIKHRERKNSIINDQDLANWNREYQNLIMERNSVLADWQVLGSKQEVESALAVFQKVFNSRSDFLKKWNDTKNIKLNDKLNDGVIQFLPTTCLPNSIYQYNAPVWKKITLNETEINQLVSSFSSTTPSSITDQFGNVEAQLSSISFEYCFLDIIRPWFEESVINNRYWKFREEGKLLSRGVVDNEILPGEVQSYPVKLILTKNIDFALKPDNQVNEALKNDLVDGKRIFFGPLLLKSIPANLNNVSSFRVQSLSDNQLSVLANAVTDDSKQLMGVAPVRKSKFRILQKLNKQPFSETKRNIENKSEIRRAILASSSNIKIIGRKPLPGLTNIGTNLPDSYFIISGQVRDQVNNPIEGAEIQIMIGENTLIKSVLSQADGSYSFSGMEQGMYHFKVSKRGFTTEERELQINNPTTLNFSLEIHKEIDYFQVIGVVCKNLPKLPDPIPEANYI